MIFQSLKFKNSIDTNLVKMAWNLTASVLTFSNFTNHERILDPKKWHFVNDTIFSTSSNSSYSRSLFFQDGKSNNIIILYTVGVGYYGTEDYGTVVPLLAENDVIAYQGEK